MPQDRGPRRAGDDSRRTALVDAAWRVIARDGVAAATTRRIAAEADAPQGLVHYWFSGKDELLGAVATRPVEKIRALTDGMDADRSRADLGAAFLRAFAASVEGDRLEQLAIYELTLWSLRSGDFAHVAREQYEAYRQISADALTELDLGLTGAELGAASQYLAALFDGVALAWLSDPEGTDIEAIFRFAADALGAMLGSRAAS